MNVTVTGLTDELLKSYAAVGGINHLDGKNLPSKCAVVAITVDLLRLVFPGFFDDKPIHSSELKVETIALMDSVLGRLEDELYKSLDYATPEGMSKQDVRPAAHRLATDFLKNLPALREILQTDADAAFRGDPAALSREEVIVAYPFMEAIAVQRMAHQLYLKGVPLIPRIMTEWAHGRTGMDIHPGARIGSHFFVDHCTGTVIGETCEIGNRVKLYQGVSLIARSLSGGQALKGRKRHPTIEDDVTVYAGATIMGGDTIIGARSTIGANVFILQSIPPDSLVLAPETQLKVLNKLEHKSGTGKI
ncbi:MAG: serine acetyltransferase [Verrucomicrobia bacterium]|nr:serine acetyltransferase [Verrucomicrobiota bacterium]